jgi:drug/metabolite transporter (DMT)-like permease
VPTLAPELLALCAAAFVAVSHVATKAGVTALASTRFLAARWTLSVVGMSVLWTLTGAWAGFRLDWRIWTVVVAALLGSVIGWTVYTHAVARLDVSLAQPLSQGASVVSVLAAILVLGERPGPLTLVGTLVVMLGIFLIHHQRGPRSKRRFVSTTGVALAFATAVVWGIGNIFWKLSVVELSIEQVVWTRAFFPAMVAVAVAVHASGPRFVGTLSGRGVVLAGATAICGDLLGFGLNFLALRNGNVSTVIPLFYSSPLFVALFSRSLLSEHVDRWRVAGILALAVGVALVALPAG